MQAWPRARDRAVGTNMYANTQERPLAVQPVRPEISAPEDAAVHVRPLAAHRWTEQFEKLRMRTESYMREDGKAFQVFLANMGPVSQHKARADFSRGFFEVANFEVLGKPALQALRTPPRLRAESARPWL